MKNVELAKSRKMRRTHSTRIVSQIYRSEIQSKYYSDLQSVSDFKITAADFKLSTADFRSSLPVDHITFEKDVDLPTLEDHLANWRNNRVNPLRSKYPNGILYFVFSCCYLLSMVDTLFSFYLLDFLVFDAKVGGSTAGKIYLFKSMSALFILRFGPLCHCNAQNR